MPPWRFSAAELVEIAVAISAVAVSVAVQSPLVGASIILVMLGVIWMLQRRE